MYNWDCGTAKQHVVIVVVVVMPFFRLFSVIFFCFVCCLGGRSKNYSESQAEERGVGSMCWRLSCARVKDSVCHKL